MLLLQLWSNFLIAQEDIKPTLDPPKHRLSVEAAYSLTRLVEPVNYVPNISLDDFNGADYLGSRRISFSYSYRSSQLFNPTLFGGVEHSSASLNILYIPPPVQGTWLDRTQSELEIKSYHLGFSNRFVFSDGAFQPYVSLGVGTSFDMLVNTSGQHIYSNDSIASFQDETLHGGMVGFF